MSEIVIVAVIKAKPGREDELDQALGGLVAPTHGEAGCVLYAMHRGIDDPTRFAFVERWESREHLDGHMNSARLVALGAQIEELLAEPPEIVLYEARALGEERKGTLAGAAG